MYKLFLKRTIDFLAAFCGLVLLAPLLLIVAAALAIANRGQIFFIQERPGKNARLFRIVKFKTMNDRRDADGHLLPDSQRITRVGRIVRAASLDEIPQLVNVLKGDMSLIGPRPLKAHNLLVYTPEQMRRHEVRPGITGWAQVNGRNHCKLSKKFACDVWYVDHLSFAVDCKIVLLTIREILFRTKDVGLGADDMQQIDDIGFMDKLNELRKKGVIE